MKYQSLKSDTVCVCCLIQTQEDRQENGGWRSWEERGLMGMEFQFRKTKILEILYNNVDVLHMTKLEKG